MTRPNRPTGRSALASALAPIVVLALAACSASSATSSPPSSATPSTNPTSGPSAPPSTTPTIAPTSAPPSAVASTAEGWRRVPTQAALDAVQLEQVVWTGSQFLGFGTTDAGGTILASPDGSAWHLQAVLPGDVGIGGLAVDAAGRLVAVGSSGSSARSWTSTDAVDWTASPTSSSLAPAAGDSLGMSAVVATANGWLAVGGERSPCTVDCDGAVVRAVAWTSTDGLHWTRQPGSTSLDRATMNDVVPGGPGFIAVGLAPDHPGSTTAVAIHAVVWTSSDGTAWSRVPDASLFHAPSGTDQQFGDSMQSVTVADGRIVAVGLVGTQDAVGSAVAWWSTDGRTWSRSSGERFPYGQMFHVTAVPGGFLATGPSGPDSCLGGIWQSADGASWACVAADPAFVSFAAYAAAASPTVEVVVGLGDTSVSLGTVAWVRSLP